MAAVCFNTVEAQKLGLPKPQSWFDLLEPQFKGKITMPHPASSGTGYFHVSAWIQTFGEERAWEFMDRLHDNIAFYVHSGSQPCKLAAAGEFPLGIAAEISAADARHKGAPIEGLIDEGGRRLGDGHRGDPARHQEPRGGQAADGLRGLAQGQRALRHLREPGRHARHRQQHPRLSGGRGRSR